MEFEKTQKYMEYLFRTALKKCGDIQDAEDLTQDTLLALLNTSEKISDVKSWLSAVLNHKYYDMLRRKYKMPTVSIDLVPEEITFCESDIDDIDNRPDEKQVRQAVAYLSEKYRTVIIKHYLQGQRVETIATDLGIPKGTVLSRLSAGREQMRKGLETVDFYEKQSYQPERLEVHCNGSPGFHDEPWSLTANDLMKQNILIIAYEKPLTAPEIAHALGIPTAYIEVAVNSLVASELMQKSGNKYYTDFRIITPDELERFVEVEIAFVEQNYTELLEQINEYLTDIRKIELSKILSPAEQGKLEYYFLLHLFSSALYTVTQRIVPSREEYPERPNGGRWIAEGTKYPSDFDFKNYKFSKYTYGGERRAYWENFLDSKSIELRVYDTQPDLNQHEHGPVEIHEDNLAKLLYIILREISFESTGFNLMFCEDIPHLTKCGILGNDNGKPFVNIPVISPQEYQKLDKIRLKHMYSLADFLEPGLKEIFPQLKFEIPKHLEGHIAGCRQYSCYAIPMAFIKAAIARQDFHPEQATPPMVFVVDASQ